MILSDLEKVKRFQRIHNNYVPIVWPRTTTKFAVETFVGEVFLAVRHVPILKKRHNVHEFLGLINKWSSVASIALTKETASAEQKPELRIGRRMIVSSGWRSSAVVKPHHALAAWLRTDRSGGCWLWVALRTVGASQKIEMISVA